MDNIWIEESGCCSAAVIQKRILEKSDQFVCYFAYLTDAFLAGPAEVDELKELQISKLLEIRLFCEERELLAIRSGIGEDFSWRVASDEARHKNFEKVRDVANKSIYLPDCEEDTYYVRKHFIDMNTAKTVSIAENGNLHLMSTVGGTYSLPIRKEHKRIKIMTYLSYSKDGMAKVADNRVCCFCE